MIGGYVGWWALIDPRLQPGGRARDRVRRRRSSLGTATELISVQPLISRRNEVDFEMVTFITTFAVAIMLTNIALQHFGP